MMQKYSKLASLVLNTPLLVTPQYAETLAVVLQDRFDLNVEGMKISSDPATPKETIVSNGTYVLPIVGSMSHRATGIEALSGMTSYQSIRKEFDAALNDPKISRIVLDIDSPGGAVSGAFDLRDHILASRGKKPIIALARDSMCSAAYLIGSAADKIYATQTARIGSIGVVMMHVDRSKQNEKEGISPTFLYKGNYKTAGNPNGPLDDETKAYIQESIDASYDMFVKAVSEARGIDEQKIMDTQAKVYLADKALELGLIDGITTFEALISSNSKYNPKGMNMENTELDTKISELENALNAEKAKGETLRKMVLDAGYAITANGLEKSASEYLIVGGEKINTAELPDVVVSALKEKADAELAASATAALPNLRIDVAKKLYSAFSTDEEVMKTIAHLNTNAGELLTESGNKDVSVDLVSAEDKLNQLVETTMNEKSLDFYAAYQSVALTPQGKLLINEIYKNKE